MKIPQRTKQLGSHCRGSDLDVYVWDNFKNKHKIRLVYQFKCKIIWLEIKIRDLSGYRNVFSNACLHVVTQAIIKLKIQCLSPEEI